jgi:predicted AlkP superfamily phosphohydrolase/phosphomutase
MQAGKMPTLQWLAEGGVTGPLESTVPDLTPPAWTSFMTGRRPENHGIFWFGHVDIQNQKFMPSSSSMIRAETLWQILSRHGKKVGVVNVPMTFPPEPINGFMITGMLTPGTHLQFTHPANLRNEIRHLVGEYHLDVSWEAHLDHTPLAFLSTVEAMTRQRARIVRYLQDHYPMDVLVVVFVGADRIHHVLWEYAANHSDPGNLRNFPIIRQRIVSFYSGLDNIIGEIIATAGSQSNVVLMSDHGFGPYRRGVYLNKWLAQLGLLTPRGSQRQRSLRSIAKRFGKRIGLNQRRVSRVIGLEGFRKLKAMGYHIDWQHTKAYSTRVGIQINLAGRENGGIVQPGEYESLRREIIEQLNHLVDPETGKPVFVGIEKEKIYQGRFVDEAPGDIILLANDDGYLATSTAVDVADTFFQPKGWSPGCHRPDGILLTHGPIFRAGVTVEESHITDIAPTILHALNLPVPADMDGKPVEQVFEPGFWSTHPVQWDQTSGDLPSDRTDTGLDSADQAMVEKRLRALGYL